jgi:hypothetical protein
MEAAARGRMGAMTAPQTQKKVGVGGCLVSVLLFVLSIAAFFGLIVWATLGVVNSLQAAPSIPLGSSGTVNITQTGTQYVFLGDLDSGGSIPAFDPDVKITDPSGNPVIVKAPSTTSSGSSGNGSFRSIGEFNAATTGAYTVDATSASPFRNAKIYVASFDIGNLGAKLLLAFGVGGLLFVLSLILFIVWLVRRSRAKKAQPPYQGGGGYPPAGGYPAQPSYPQQPGYPQQPSYPQPPTAPPSNPQPGGGPQNPPPQ